MIRINLISQTREKPRRRAAATCCRIRPEDHRRLHPDSRPRALGIGWWYWSLRKEAAKLTDDITAAEAETRRLQALSSRSGSSRRARPSCRSA